MKRLLTMALVLAMMATMFAVTPVAYAADVAMNITATPAEDGIDLFSASFTGVEDATWVVWTVYATNDTADTLDDEIIYVEQKRGNRAADEGFSFTFDSNVETALKAKTPFVAEAKIYFANSAYNTTKTGEYVYLPYAEIQEYIRELFDMGDGESISDAATKLGVVLPSCYAENDAFDALVIDCLETHPNYTDRDYATKKETTYSYGDPTTNIVPSVFYDDIKNAVLLTAINSENAESISNLIQADYEAVGISAEDATWFSGSPNKAAIATKLAGFTYETPADFVTLFKGFVFLDELKLKDSVDIIAFIKDAVVDDLGNPVFSYYPDETDDYIDDTPTPFVIDIATFDSYTVGDDNADNLEKAQFELSDDDSYEFLEDFKEKFDGILYDFANPVVPTPDPGPGPGYTPPSGGTVSVTPQKPIVGEDAPKFTDIDNVGWAHEAINTLAKEGVIVGVTNTQFQPEANVTREQFVQIIVKTFGLKGTGVKAPFADIDQGAWYAESLNIAYELGIVSGISEDTFGVGATITRQDMATIMFRVAKYLGIDLTAKSYRTLSDEASISGYAVEAVNTLYKAGIINGVSDGVFAGSQIATRAQAAKLCYDLREAK